MALDQLPTGLTVELNLLDDLLAVITDLSRVKDVSHITEIVRKAVRKLSGADGATFVLRDGDQCFYVDEDAIGPLWKGSRFPMSCCISGWVMIHGEPVIIHDIYKDPRIPHDAYSPTFVKSLAMVPINRNAPIGAIGAYWATKQTASPETVRMLQALADSASVAFENLDLYGKLKRKVSELEDANGELSHFAWAAAHDLREPCRTLCTVTQLVNKEYGDKFDETGRDYLETTIAAAQRLYGLIGGIMSLVGLQSLGPNITTDLQEVVDGICAQLQTFILETNAEVRFASLPTVQTDPKLLSLIIQNLLTNSLKFRSNDRRVQIEIAVEEKGPYWIVSVRDNGIGIPKEFHAAIFESLKRLQPYEHNPGSGMGLSIAKKAVELLGGEIWIDSSVMDGTRICFTLPNNKFAGDFAQQSDCHVS